MRLILDRFSEFPQARDMLCTGNCNQLWPAEQLDLDTGLCPVCSKIELDRQEQAEIEAEQRQNQLN